jgi:hypothetical protein
MTKTTTAERTLVESSQAPALSSALYALRFEPKTLEKSPTPTPLPSGTLFSGPVLPVSHNE